MCGGVVRDQVYKSIYLPIQILLISQKGLDHSNLTAKPAIESTFTWQIF